MPDDDQPLLEHHLDKLGDGATSSDQANMYFSLTQNHETIEATSLKTTMDDIRAARKDRFL